MSANGTAPQPYVIQSETIRVALPGIHPSAWEHPADRVALEALRKVPGLDTALRVVSKATTERAYRLHFLANAVRVTDRQFPRMHALKLEVCRVLGVAEPPELFVAQNPQLNAMAVGMGVPFMVFNSAMTESFTDDELLDVIGHEMAHILSGHVLYKTLLVTLVQLTSIFTPISMFVLQGLIMALREWNRKSELSADRAGLLVCQNPAVSYRVNMRLAGGAAVDQMDIDEFIKQADEYEKGTDLLDNIYKFFLTLERTHPMTVVRVAEQKRWVESGEFDKMLQGEYPTGPRDGWEDLNAAAGEYEKDTAEAASPLNDTFKKVGNEFRNATDAVRDALKGWF